MPEKPFFKVKVGDEVFELDKLTLGEARTLKRRFSLTDLAGFALLDPDQLVGLLTLAIRRKEPDLTLDEAEAKADDLDIEGFASPEEAAPEEDPTPAATGGEDVKTPDGSQETTPVPPGSPPLPVSE